MIHTLTLNPAIDKILYLDSLVKNTTNRIGEISYSVGGKGTHVSINLACLGENNDAFGICYGRTGLQIIELLSQQNIHVHFVHRSGFESRTNYLLVEENGDSTLVAEKGVPLPREDVLSLLDLLSGHILPGDPLIISGDVSNCLEKYPFERLMELCREKRPKIYLDTSGDQLRQYLQLAPYFIKPNLDELSMLCQRPVSLEMDDICRAIASLDGFRIPYIAVTLGGEGSVVKVGDAVYRVLPPKVRTKNTIGCGDCFLAGFAYGLSHHLPIDETIRISTAASSAAAESKMSVGFDRERMKELMGRERISQIR